MQRRVVLRPEAEGEALSVRQWYEARRPGLGRAFGETLEQVILRVAANPFAFPKVHNDTRRAVLPRFPYAVYFRDAGEVIVVLAVHGRQHPRRWQLRP